MGKEDVAMYIYTHTHTHTHTHKGVLLSHKKEGGNGICSNIHNLEMILLSDVHQTGKDKHLYDITYIWNLKKKDTDELI